MPHQRALTASGTTHHDEDVAAVDLEAQVALQYEFAVRHGEIVDGDVRYTPTTLTH